MFISLFSLSLASFFIIFSLIIFGFSYSVSLLFSPCSFFLLSGLEFVICIDTVVMLCLTMLFVCSLLAFIYCFHYYYGSSEAKFLFYLMVWFVMVMFFLIITNSVIFSLVMWEYLGFVSFLLILFYSNSSSVRASLITLLSSRFGDVGLFVILAYILGSCNFTWAFFFSFFLVVVTKSAGFPFVSWLLEAMRAPTPVSSLVHSSTLVAAGVWFVVRYGLYLDSFSLFFVFLVSITTIFITGLCALFFLDLKKIVALSTCNNVAWCLVYYVCNDLYLVVFQLLVHGVCKCALFILVGDLMSSSSSSQSCIGVYMSSYGGVYNVVLLVFLVFCLCGLPFMGIYFSKHFFFICVVGLPYSIFLVLLVLLGFFVSYSYSFRLSMLISSNIRGLSLGYIVSFIYVGIFTLVGSVIGWCILGNFEEYSDLSLLWSILFVFIQLFGCLFGYIVYISDFSGWFWESLLCGSDALVGFCYYFYNYFFLSSVLIVYRWEVDLLFRSLSCFSGVSGSSFVFSLNFFIWGIFIYLAFCFFFS
uniref:NADH:ubiquinone reductase (H(+)-translocating) n=1 Tax=Diplostomum ardeae TaxID=1702217 RepID=A0A6M8NLF4_9TREM|nr:NADH dehydrogenase subunit 5 [Diplostomum ardeae]QKG04355.1 NADH dehydrogenase subunit 5 [Diplostomum ardeae]